MRCFRLSQIKPVWQFQKRSYQSMVPSATTRNTNLIRESDRHLEKKSRDLQDIRDNLFLRIEQNQTLGFKVKQKVMQLNGFLTREFALNDELATLVLYPSTSHYVQINQRKDETFSDTSILNFMRVGSSLIELQISNHLLSFKLEDTTGNIGDLNFDRFDEPIHAILKSNRVLDRYLKSTGLCEMILERGTRQPSERKTKQLVRKQLHMIVGLLSFHRGERIAKKFVDKRVIESEDGLMKQAVKLLNR